MQPFDKHLADPEELARYSSRLITWGADALQNGHGTRRPYAPAIADWDELCPPEIKIAYDSTEHEVALDGALVWAAVCMQIWAQRVACFNRCVDEIQDGAEQAWWQAYNKQIFEGAAEVRVLLQEGPTAANMAKAKALGILPRQSWDLLTGIKTDLEDGLRGLLELTVPNGNGWLKRGAEATQKLRYGAQDPASSFKPRFIHKDGCEKAFKRLERANKGFVWIGRLYSARSSYEDQQSRDIGRPGLGETERIARSIYRGGVVPTGAWAGGAAGAAMGGYIGSLIAPGPGTVVGGIVGGFVGGIVGESIANKIVDHTVDRVGNAVKLVNHAIHAVIDAAGRAVSKLAEMVLGLRPRFA